MSWVWVQNQSMYPTMCRKDRWDCCTQEGDHRRCWCPQHPSCSQSCPPQSPGSWRWLCRLPGYHWQQGRTWAPPRPWSAGPSWTPPRGCSGSCRSHLHVPDEFKHLLKWLSIESPKSHTAHHLTKVIKTLKTNINFLHILSEVSNQIQKHLSWETFIRFGSHFSFLFEN